MFNITGGEVIIIAIVALVVLGPDKLPDFVRRAGRVYGEVKKISQGFKTEFRDVIEEPVREMQDTVNLAKSWFEEGKTAVGTMDDSGWNTPVEPDDPDEADTPSGAGDGTGASAGSGPRILDPFAPSTTDPTPGFDDSVALDGPTSGEAPGAATDKHDDSDADEDDDDGDDDPNFYDGDGNMLLPSFLKPQSDSFGTLPRQQPDGGVS